MKKIDNDNLKRIELELLLRIHDFCKENHLRYFLCGGTLLGAIRHKGFIPWDDDIDIHMPRPDYEYLVRHFIPDNDIRILFPGKGDYFYNFAKAINPKTRVYQPNSKQIDGYGVFIDIFPLDGLPDDPVERIRHVNKLNSIREQINTFSIEKPKIRKDLRKYFRLRYYYHINKKRDVREFQNEYIRLALMYSYDVSKYVYATGGAYLSKEIYDKEMYSESELVMFEEHLFNAPKQWDRILKQLYGDYMVLPPVEKRVSNHNFRAEYI